MGFLPAGLLLGRAVLSRLQKIAPCRAAAQRFCGNLGQRMSIRCVGGGRIVKGKSEGETGMSEYIDVSGDKIFSTFSVSNEETPGTVASHHIVAGGTGKYTGITGNWVGTRRSLRSLVEGQVLAVIVYKGSYKLP